MKEEFSLLSLQTVLYIQAMNYILIHCKPSLKNYLNENNIQWTYSQQFGNNEIDAIVKDKKDLDDEQLCSHYGIDYDQVNCIEAL